VHSAFPGYEESVGGRVVRIGKLPVEEALERVASVTQRDNEQQIKWLAPRYMSLVEVLAGTGVIDNMEYVDIRIEKDGREQTVRIEPVPLVRGMLGGTDEYSVAMNADAKQPLPRYLRWKDGEFYWFEYLEEEKLVYFQFRAVMNNRDGESIADFSRRLFEFIDKSEVESLVIDVRRNHGGNNFLLKPIIDGVIRSDINQRGRLFVAIGRETFSACQNFCNRLQRETQVLFVGEPTGSGLNFVGEGNPIQLPYTGLVVNGSSRYWQDALSDDFRFWVAPHLLAELASDDFRLNRDPTMSVIRAYLENRRGAVEGSSTNM
jgi:hypothetical protein